MAERPLLIVDESTTAEDLVAFILGRRRPIECAGSRIYDFNNHPFDPDRFAASGIPPGAYVVPFAMSEVNLDLFALLPAHLVALPRLRFNPRAETGGYSVMRSLVPTHPAAERALRSRVEAAFAES